ncbi:hypothetical protein PGT21_010141 [Puccinia graminis f. sp. tritici]|uniref:Uncharacterized protein n=2 Tax=Puccinia graminis f. sp. tritici TaxID=56615 RepID=A0A5B0PTH9_PUCGR|nr:hypothetical protein PGT21_010141 [Puccinia graminis f. sp. tritici]
MIPISMRNLIITCSIILQLLLPASSMDTESIKDIKSPCINCSQLCPVVPYEVVKANRLSFEGVCGPYVEGTTQGYCRNWRSKVYFQCENCYRYHRANWVLLEARTTNLCTKYHVNREAVVLPELNLLEKNSASPSNPRAPQELNLIDRFQGQ